MKYLLKYQIDFAGIVADREDFENEATKIHRFVAILPEKYLTEQQGIGIIPFFTGDPNDCRIAFTLVFDDSYLLQAGMELLRAFCILNYYTYDEKPEILPIEYDQ